MGATTNADAVRYQIRYDAAKDISIMLSTGTIQSITAAIQQDTYQLEVVLAEGHLRKKSNSSVTNYDIES